MPDSRCMQEDIRDLLVPDLAASPGVHIREVGGSICLAGAHETEVGSRDEMATLLDQVQHPIKPAPISSEHEEISLGPQNSRLLARGHIPGGALFSMCRSDAEGWHARDCQYFDRSYGTFGIIAGSLSGSTASFRARPMHRGRAQGPRRRLA